MKIIAIMISMLLGTVLGTVQANPDHQRALALLETQSEHEQIKPLFKQAAAAGHAPAMAYLGWWYETGYNQTEPDIEQAVRWYAKAASHGAHTYAVKLGWLYLQDDALPRDRAQAAYWFNYGQQQGYLPAYVAWGSVLVADALGGDGAAATQAVKTLTPAFVQGDAHAAYFLARLYREGIGEINPNPDKSFAYLLFGAMHNQPQMQGWLAKAYLTGEGVPKNPQTAAAWALLAVENNDPLANDLIEQIDARFTDQQWVDAWLEASEYKQYINAVST